MKWIDDILICLKMDWFQSQAAKQAVAFGGPFSLISAVELAIVSTRRIENDRFSRLKVPQSNQTNVGYFKFSRVTDDDGYQIMRPFRDAKLGLEVGVLKVADQEDDGTPFGSAIQMM